jgi:hypothetical protein
MTLKIAAINIKKLVGFIDWKLLVFLTLFLDVKLIVKVVAIVLVYLFQFDLKFGFRLKNSRLPLFYLLVIGIAVLNGLIYKSYVNIKYDAVFLTGIGFWLLCILAVHQVKLSVEKNNPEILHNTILVFFVLNVICSLLTLTGIMAEIHTLNPYRYQGQYQKYFIGTGDYIKGLTFDVSTTNAVINAFGVIYFLVRKNAFMALTCMGVMLLTGSNSVNLMLSGILLLLFIFNSTRDQKSVIAICFIFLGIFMTNVSPQNDDYIVKTYRKIINKELPVKPVVILNIVPVTQKPDSILSPEEKRQKIALLYLDSVSKAETPKMANAQNAAATNIAIPLKHEIPAPSIHTAPFQHKDDSTGLKVKLQGFVKAEKPYLPEAAQPTIPTHLPGKVIAMQQTIGYLNRHPKKALTGDGMGNFSSKLAFKATGLGIAGGFPARYTYISSSFLTNHLDAYLTFFSKSEKFHSLINSPNSVYDQLLGEYGLLGLIAFIIFYAGYFLRGPKKLTYGIPIFILMAGVFLLDYWFEQLSVIVLFELLLLVNIKETSPKTLSYAK